MAFDVGVLAVGGAPVASATCAFLRIEADAPAANKTTSRRSRQTETIAATCGIIARMESLLPIRLSLLPRNSAAAA
jgi:hypothetical protein